MSKLVDKLSKNPDLQGRFLAWKSLTDMSIKQLPTEKLAILARRYEISSNNRAFAKDLLSGTIKRKLAIDNIVEKIAKCKIKSIEPNLLAVLRLGVYQLIFDEDIPDFAAIDTSCRLAGVFAKRKQIGFVNAVLRSVQRAIAERNVKICELREDKKGIGTDILPIDIDRGIRFIREILPEFNSNPAKYLSVAYSYPQWLVQRWLKFWELETLKMILSAGNARVCFVFRPNRLKLPGNSAEQLAEHLKREGCDVSIVGDCRYVLLKSAPAITKLSAYKEGLFQVQDTTAAMLVRNIKLDSKMKILDLCAGLGTKTTQIAEITDDEAEIFASDKNEEKLQILMRNAKRLGIKSIRSISVDELSSERYHRYFDVVILDVPCTNSGVFDRRPEARWRIRKGDFDLFGQASRELLETAQELVREDGQIGFSTCSIDRRENEDVVKEFIKRNEYTIVKQESVLPVYDKEIRKTVMSGGYYCVLSRM